MEPTTLKEHPSNIYTIGKNKALRSAVIYGPNASGKSNLIRAFRAIIYLVEKSAEFSPGKEILPYEPHRLDKKSASSPVYFELEFIADNKKKYLFIVSFSRDEILREEAYTFQKGQKALIYSRKNKGVTYGDYYKGERKSLEKKLLPNQLLISKAVLDNNELLTPIYHFFKYEMMVISWLYDYQQNRVQQLFAKRLANEEDLNFNKRFNTLICALDTGIVEVKSHEEPWDAVSFPDNVPTEVQDKLKNDYKYNIKASHKVFDNGVDNGTVPFDKEDESQGTRNLFSIAGLILDALEFGSTLVVDEFDNNLHPHITKVLVQLFHNPKINTNNAQLIFATHDTSQLDNSLFRRDQIWFTEKNEFGATSMYCLSDIQGVRNTVPYDKWYNSGKLGATPVINELELLFNEE